MKKIDENRFPNAVNLFWFCRQALELRSGKDLRVIDQDVGAILDYDPADCSHWKKGKKNIRSIDVMKTIANHLDIDERTVIDLSQGRVTLDEATAELKSSDVPALSILAEQVIGQGGECELEKKAWVAKILKVEDQVIEFVSTLHEKGNIRQAPVYLPEVYRLLPQMKGKDFGFDPFMGDVSSAGRSMQTTNPTSRFLGAMGLFKKMIEHGEFDLAEESGVGLHYLSYVFAVELLLPRHLFIQQAMMMHPGSDMVQQLANSFWVSKAVVNYQLKKII